MRIQFLASLTAGTQNLLEPLILQVADREGESPKLRFSLCIKGFRSGHPAPVCRSGVTISTLFLPGLLCSAHSRKGARFGFACFVCKTSGFCSVAASLLALASSSACCRFSAMMPPSFTSMFLMPSCFFIRIRTSWFTSTSGVRGFPPGPLCSNCCGLAKSSGKRLSSIHAAARQSRFAASQIDETCTFMAMA